MATLQERVEINETLSRENRQFLAQLSEPVVSVFSVCDGKLYHEEHRQRKSHRHSNLAIWGATRRVLGALSICWLNGCSANCELQGFSGVVLHLAEKFSLILWKFEEGNNLT